MADRTKQLTRTQKRQKVTRTEGNCLNKMLNSCSERMEKYSVIKQKAEAKKTGNICRMYRTRKSSWKFKVSE